MLLPDEAQNRLAVQLESAKTPQDRIDLLNRLGLLQRLSQIEQTQVCAEESYQLAIKHEYMCGVAGALTNLAYTAQVRGEFKQALTYLWQALELARQHDISFVLADGLALLALHQANGGNLPEAFENMLEALRIAEAIDDKYLLFSTLNDLGILYTHSDDYEKALKSFQECLHYCQSDQSGLPVSIMYSVQHNIANTCVKLGRYDEALAQSEENLRWYCQAGDVDGQSSALCVLGESYLLLGQPDKAMQVFQDILTLLPRHQNIEIEIETYINIGRYYLQLKNPHDALDYLLKAKLLLDQTPINYLLVTVYEKLAATYRQLGNYETALGYYEQYHTCEKEAFNTQADQRLKATQVMYETEKTEKEKEIYRLRTEALWQEFEDHKRTEAERLKLDRLKIALEQEQELSQLKTQIMVRLSHELRTPLSVIQTGVSLLTRYSSRLTEEKRLMYDSMITDQVTHLIKILDDITSILRGPDDKQNFSPREVVLDEALQQIVAHIKDQLDAPERVVTELNITGSLMILDAGLLERILNELVANALKFSPADSPVTVRADCDGPSLTLAVVDQGVGIPESEQENVLRPFIRGSNIDEIPGIGLGLSLVETLIHIHQGEITIESQEGQGTTVTLHLTSSGRGIF